MTSPPNNRLILPNRKDLSDPTNIQAIERWAQNFTVNKIVAGNGISLSQETPAFGPGAEGTGVVTISGGGSTLPWYQAQWTNVIHADPIVQGDFHPILTNYRGHYQIGDNFASPPMRYTVGQNPIIANADLANLLFVAVPSGTPAPATSSTSLGVVVSHIMGFPSEPTTDNTQMNYYAASSFITGVSLQGSAGGFDVYQFTWHNFVLLSNAGTDIQKPSADIVLNAGIGGTATLQVSIDLSVELVI